MVELPQVVRRACMAFLLMGLVGVAVSQETSNRAQPVGDPAVEARVQRLSEDLRCLTCMGQNIADSQSGFSADMKREMRDMIKAGKSDKDIMDFMVQRYGDFVLYRPPVKNTTWLLWGGPFVLLLLSIGLLIRKLKRRRVDYVPAPLNESELRAAAKLLGTDQERKK